MLNDEQAAKKLIELSNELEDTHPFLSLITGVIGHMTYGFEQEALHQLADYTAMYGQAALNVLKKSLEKEE